MRFLQELAKSGRFVTFQPRYRFMPELEKSSLVFVPLDDTTKDSDEFVMVIDRRLNLRPAPDEFVRFAARYLADMTETTQSGSGSEGKAPHPPAGTSSP